MKIVKIVLELSPEEVFLHEAFYNTGCPEDGDSKMAEWEIETIHPLLEKWEIPWKEDPLIEYPTSNQVVISSGEEFDKKGE